MAIAVNIPPSPRFFPIQNRYLDVCVNKILCVSRRTMGIASVVFGGVMFIASFKLMYLCYQVKEKRSDVCLAISGAGMIMGGIFIGYGQGILRQLPPNG